MSDVVDLATTYQVQQVSLARRIAQVVLDLWRGVNVDDITRSWVATSTEAYAQVAAGQMLAAAMADPYTTSALTAQGINPAASGQVQPRAFAGIASDGRPLETLLLEPAITVKTAIGRGAAPAKALESGGFLLDMIVRTQIADAGRTAAGAAIVARRNAGGYVRMLNPPSCSRCAVLAGRWYRWNQGFDRHPRCDCRHIPSSEDRADDLRTEPGQYFRSLSTQDQDRLFTKAGAQSIRDGADIGQVVNARRGMTPAGTTTESTTRAGVAAPGRLMPEAIYQQADEDRSEAIRLLRAHGYLT